MKKNRYNSSLRVLSLGGRFMATMEAIMDGHALIQNSHVISFCHARQFILIVCEKILYCTTSLAKQKDIKTHSRPAVVNIFKRFSKVSDNINIMINVNP